MKAALYIEQTVKKGPKKGEVMGWGGYIYATETINPADYTFVKQAKDQWDKTVKVYKAKETRGIETPGGVMKSNLVVLF
jgi:hypothetical protein